MLAPDETGSIRERFKRLCTLLSANESCITDDQKETLNTLVTVYKLRERCIEAEKLLEELKRDIENPIRQYAPSFQLDRGPSSMEEIIANSSPARSASITTTTSSRATKLFGSIPLFLRKEQDPTQKILDLIPIKRLDCCFSRMIKPEVTVQKVRDFWRTASTPNTDIHLSLVREQIVAQYLQEDNQPWLLPHSCNPKWRFLAPDRFRIEEEDSENGAAMCTACFCLLACISRPCLKKLKEIKHEEYKNKQLPFGELAKDIIDPNQGRCCSRNCLSKLDPKELESEFSKITQEKRKSCRDLRHLADRISQVESANAFRFVDDGQDAHFEYWAQKRVFVKAALSSEEQRQLLIGVCRRAFCVIHQVTSAELRFLQLQFKTPENSGSAQLTLSPRVHGNTGRLPKNALQPDQKRLVASLAQWVRNNVAEPYAGVQPQDPSLDPNTDAIVYITPAWLTRIRLFSLLQNMFQSLGVPEFQIKSFFKLWNQYSGDLIPANHRTAVCDKCSLLKGAQTDIEKKLLQEHKAFATVMRMVIEHFTRASTDSISKLIADVSQKDSSTWDSASMPQQGINTNSSMLTLVADYQESFGIPHLRQTPALFFFHHQMWIYNLGIWSPVGMKCAVYHEITGGKGANEVISVIHRVLMHEDDGLLRRLGSEWLILASDGCGGQCHNRIVVSYLHELVRRGYVKRATHVTYVRGHSKMKCDAFFGCIARECEQFDIFSAKEFQEAISLVGDCQGINMEESMEDFKDWKKLVREFGYRNIPGIRDAKWIDISVKELGVVKISNLPPKDILNAAGVSATLQSMLPKREVRTLRILPRGAIRKELNPVLAPLHGMKVKKIKDILSNVWGYVQGKQMWPWNELQEMEKKGGRLARRGEQQVNESTTETQGDEEEAELISSTVEEGRSDGESPGVEGVEEEEEDEEESEESEEEEGEDDDEGEDGTCIEEELDEEEVNQLEGKIDQAISAAGPSILELLTKGVRRVDKARISQAKATGQKKRRAEERISVGTAKRQKKKSWYRKPTSTTSTANSS